MIYWYELLRNENIIAFKPTLRGNRLYKFYLDEYYTNEIKVPTITKNKGVIMGTQVTVQNNEYTDEGCQEVTAKKKPMSPVLEALVEYAYRAGRAEDKSEQLIMAFKDYKANRDTLDTMQRQIDDLRSYRDQANRETQEMRNHAHELHATIDRMRANARRKSAPKAKPTPKAPVKAVKKTSKRK